MSIKEIEEESRSHKGWTTFFKLVGFRDFTIPPIAFFKGNQLYRYLKELIGECHFKDLRTPLLVTAVNVFTSEEEVFREGEVALAVRASISIPGIIKPAQIGHKHLIDGGIIDPLPVHILQEAGCRKIIAVNVLPSPEDFKEKSAIYSARKEEIEAKMRDKGMLGKFFYSLNRKFQKKMQTNVFNVMMNTIQFMEYTLCKAHGIDADIVIHPVVPESNWADFFEPDKFIKVGEIRTREVLPEIRKLVEDR